MCVHRRCVVWQCAVDCACTDGMLCDWTVGLPLLWPIVLKFTNTLGLLPSAVGIASS